MAIDWARPVECPMWGRAVRVAQTSHKVWLVEFADSQVWNYDDDGRWYGDSSNACRQLRNPLTDEPEGMAGLRGFAPVFKSAWGSFHMRGVWGASPEYAFNATDGFGANVAVIDLSKVPASAIVKPEPKRETRRVWIVFWAGHGATVHDIHPGDVSIMKNPTALAIVEREIEFTHGEGLNKDRLRVTFP